MNNQHAGSCKQGVEAYIKEVPWGDELSTREKMLVLENLRAFAAKQDVLLSVINQPAPPGTTKARIGHVVETQYVKRWYCGGCGVEMTSLDAVITHKGHRRVRRSAVFVEQQEAEVEVPDEVGIIVLRWRGRERLIELRKYLR